MNRVDEKGRAEGVLTWINGPVVKARGMADRRMLELVRVGRDGLIGEIIEIRGDIATIQVYEETAGLKPGEKVIGSGAPLTVELGPGMLSQIFDGIQRPLERIRAATGDFVSRGVETPALERMRTWHFEPRLETGSSLAGGEILGVVAETLLVEHRVLVPPGIRGTLRTVSPAGAYTVEDPIATVATDEGEVTLTMMQRWQVRRARPIAARLRPAVPLVTGQRVIDIFFPLAKGGTAAIPGGFGTGKTVTQHNLAKWCDADIIVYIGCGERGNEMTGVLTDFPELRDPRSGHPLMERTILIANTSNMPVAAREASIYTGVTLAEYFRDMGYHVAVMADSTSRWAEALREISGRLEEMPAEEGFPAYLATRLAEFYERAGRVQTLGGAEGSVAIIGAVSPPGGDFSEPVTQHTQRFVRCFWSLDKTLASARFFPSINVIDSYSEYHAAVAEWWREEGGEDIVQMKEMAGEILREDYRLQQIVRLIGEDSLPDDQRMIVLAARLIKEGFLQQDAFDPVDMYALPAKQVKMLRAILRFIEMSRILVRKGIPLLRLRELDILQALRRMKSTIANDRVGDIDELLRQAEEEIRELYPLEDWDEGVIVMKGKERRAFELAGQSRSALYEEARKKDIPGRSTMSKEELARRLAEQETEEEPQP
jgi:V/A-type H+/Na+-transporting ATPase subunit A